MWRRGQVKHKCTSREFSGGQRQAGKCWVIWALHSVKLTHKMAEENGKTQEKSGEENHGGSQTPHSFGEIEL